MLLYVLPIVLPRPCDCTATSGSLSVVSNMSRLSDDGRSSAPTAVLPGGANSSLSPC